MRRHAVLLGLALAAPPALRAQAEDQLQQAIRAYENLDIERARLRFLQVISPSSPFAVTESQRVTAYKYLGAAWAQLGQPDSSFAYFVGALQRDPLVDLDPRQFTQGERDAFAAVKRRLFKVGMGPIARDTISPRDSLGSEELRRALISIATTHAGFVRLELVGASDEQRYVLFEGDLDGPRDVPITGLDPRGSGFVPQGVYDVVLVGESRLLRPATADSAGALLEITHIVAPLEDTLRSFGANDTLPTRRPPSAATKELLLGLGVAAGAVVSSRFIGASDLSGKTVLSSGVAALGVGAGIWAFLERRAHPEIPANVAENQRRFAVRADSNAAIMERNRARLAATRLVLRPLGQ